MISAQHPVLAVVDRGPEDTVIWHVQTDPAAASVLSGAWIVEGGDRGLLAGAHVVDSAGQVEAIIASVQSEVEALRAAAKKAKEKTPSLTVPRFDDLAVVEPAELAETFHGDPRAEQAWSLAVSLAEVVEYWHTLESSRKMRTYLVDEFGVDIRPVPVTPGEAP